MVGRRNGKLQGQKCGDARQPHSQPVPNHLARDSTRNPTRDFHHVNSQSGISRLQRKTPVHTQHFRLAPGSVFNGRFTRRQCRETTHTPWKTATTLVLVTTSKGCREATVASGTTTIRYQINNNPLCKTGCNATVGKIIYPQSNMSMPQYKLGAW